MRTFVRVADVSSFTEAASQLGVPRSSVSAAVQQLEARLGTRLLHRTTRRVELTQDGLAYHARCVDLLADLDESQAMFSAPGRELSGRLRFDMPLGTARHVVLPRLPEFLAAYPKLEVEVSSTDRRVDLVREGFDCVLRVGTLSDSSLVGRRIGEYRQINVASPDYLARKGKPRRLEDLRHHALVHYVPTLGVRHSGFEVAESDGSVTRIAMSGAVTVNNSEAYLAACLAGLGLIQAPAPAMRPLIRQGSLVEVLPRHRAPPLPVSIVYPHRRHLPQRVHVFVQWLEVVLKPHLEIA